MITDERLDRESPEDEPMLLAWDLADRIEKRASARGASNGESLGFGLRAISELIYRVADNHPGSAEAIAQQLTAMAGYVRKNMK